MNVKDVESRLAGEVENLLRDLNYLVPPDRELCVSLRNVKGRKTRSDASSTSWSPSSGTIEISFEPVQHSPHPDSAQKPKAADEVTTQPATLDHFGSATAHLLAAEVELLKALDRAESRPGWNFVPLKKFRDEILPGENRTESLRTDADRQQVLRSAIEKRFILVSKVPNPKSPQFPVTTVRLNRLMPEVKQALGQAANQTLDFHPIEIPGEPLSATVLRERR
jgi:hypothetical protein